MNIFRETLFFCWMILCVDFCLSQRNCTGVTCPVLENCIDIDFEEGSCCPNCRQRGCICRGYQLYDCENAGFDEGRVPEGESYTVDFGSTECSCPQGGGNITCHYIPCPEIPPTCIEFDYVADACMQCARVGCTFGNMQYGGGQIFLASNCQICRCPDEGGEVTCLTLFACRPTEETSSDLKSPLREISSSLEIPQPSPKEPFSKLALGNTLPLYKQGPPSFGSKDHDYVQAEPTSSANQNFPQPLESAAPSPAYPGLSSATFFPRDNKRHGQTQTQQSQTPGTSNENELVQNIKQATTGATNELQTPLSTATTQRVKTESHSPQQEAGERDARHNSDRSRLEQESLKDTTNTPRSNSGVRHQHRHSQSGHARNHGRSRSVDHPGREKQSEKPGTPAGEDKQSSFPTILFSPTRRTPIRVREDSEEPRAQPQNLLYNLTEAPGEQKESGKELVKLCCESGEKWASTSGHCSSMEPLTKDRLSLCWSVQQQCCLGSLRESRCSAGINAARAGSSCDGDAGAKCGVDSYKECCGCCSLGLQFHKEGHLCEPHHYLGFYCQYVFLTCCEGKHKVREKPALDSTSLPRKVSDSPFPKEAFSIGEEQGVENAVEEGDLECLLYERSICHHRCIKTPGSFRCECFPGYVLQDDAFTCVQETVDEVNKVSEADRAAVETAPQIPPPTVPPNPCEGNGICEQQCTPVGGRPTCSCFAGYALRNDGRSCGDVNECLSARACQPNERCTNTVGSYVCRRLITCPPGYQINNDVCEDIDECAQGSHNCATGFECVNTGGSFRCNAKARCAPGFSQDAQGNCVDVDECGASTQPCKPGFNCINTVGSYMCNRKIACSHGYHASADGSRCVDVDECESSLHRCGEGQLCHNSPGSYRCECRTGYQYDSFRKTCVDVDECWRYPGRLCAQTCENTPGSYQCSCFTGFRLSGDGKSCEDVNECLTSPCSQECANIYSSYRCYCRQGYYLREDGHTCEDIDECSQSIGHLCTYKCVNVPGSYQCACPEHGYTVSPNKHSCVDVDECATESHNCSLTDTCYNIQGGYRCLSLSCPPNYRKVSKTRCERLSCPNYLDCQNSPLTITHYYLSYQSNIIVPAQIFRIGPSPAYSGDNVIITITDGNEESYFSTKKLNAYTGAVYLQRQVPAPRDFLITVEMKLWRQGTFTTFQAKMYVFITANLH